MKNLHFLLWVIILPLFTEACSSDELDNTIVQEGHEILKIEAVLSPFDVGDTQSRTAFNFGSTSVDTPVWAKGDTIGIYPSAGGDQLSFPIIEGINTNKCVFTGGGWALKASTPTEVYKYTAYYPFNRNYYSLKDNKTLPINMLGQEQIGNNNSSHLGAYHIQIANGGTPTSGKISFKFKHKVAFVRMDITTPCAATWKSITLNSTAAFTTKATMNLSLSEPTIIAQEQTNSVTLDLKNVSTTADNLQIVAYMAMLPVNFTNKTLVMELFDTNGNMYTAPVSIDNPTNVENPLIFGASNARWISAKFSKGASPNIPYVTFMADAEQSFSMSQEVLGLEYSVNGDNWYTLGEKTITFGGKYGILQIRGRFNPSGTGVSPYDYSRIILGNNTPVACSGDIRTLLDYDNYTTVDTSNAKFCGLFWGCKVLTSAPKLPSTTLAESCYANMFAYCSSLKNAPELPATTLAESCYQDMFRECTSLTTAPELPATTLADFCYEYMFSGCASLTAAPELPATTLASYCYGWMFSHCTSLTTLPKLPAMNLTDGCYSDMFYFCTSLTTAPELPATSLASNCYNEMFYGCESMKQAPELPALILESSCYEGMFRGCISLTSPPELPAQALADACYAAMFAACWNLEYTPELPAMSVRYRCYESMFSECTNLTIAPELPAIALEDMCYASMFGGCYNLTSAPKLPAETLKRGCYAYMFGGCRSLQSITMLATNIDAEDCMIGWLNEVYHEGVFTKAKEMNSLPIGESGIPGGWTVKNYGEE